MLDAMRQRASSWVVRLLLLLLIASFAVWGIGDIFLGGGSSDTVAEVGEIDITARELNAEFEQEYSRFQQQFGGAIDRRQAMELGLLNQSLQTLIARRLVDMHARELGLGVADSEVAAAIRNNPLFAGSNGLDRQRLELYLRSRGLNEDAFVEEVREDLARVRLIDAISGAVFLPDTLAERLSAYRDEQRRATVLTVLASAQQVDDPDEATLAAWLEENQERFQTPERRSFVAVTLRPEDLVDEIAVDDAALRSAYEARLDFYTDPERREVAQLVAPDEDTIRAAHDALAAGSTMAQVADEMADKGVAFSTLGPAARTDLPGDLADAIFGLDEGSLGEPVSSPFGWHIFRVTAIRPGSVRPFEEVRDELHDELALQQASDQLPDLATALDDEIAAGASLEEAAATLGLKADVFEQVDAAGRDASGADVTRDRLDGEMLQTIFAAPEGETSLLEETAAGHYYMYRVDSIEPSRPSELAEVEPAVRAAWLAEARRKAAGEQAEALLAQASEGKRLEAIAEELGDAVTLREVGPVRRSADGRQTQLSPDAIAAIFATPEGRIAAEAQAVPTGSAILRVDEVIPAPAEGAGDEALQGELADGLSADILVQYESALRRRYPIEINEAAVAALLPPAN